MDTLGIQVPRLDLDRRDALNVCNRVTSATEEEVEAAWKFLSGGNRCHLSWSGMIPCRVGCVDGDSDGSTHGSLEDYDPDFRMDGVLDLTTEVLLQPGEAAEVPVSWQTRRGLESPRPEEFEVRPSPYSSVEAVRGLWGDRPQGRVIVSNSSSEEVWLAQGEVVAWGVKRREKRGGPSPGESSKDDRPRAAGALC